MNQKYFRKKKKRKEKANPESKQSSCSTIWKMFWAKKNIKVEIDNYIQTN